MESEEQQQKRIDDMADDMVEAIEKDPMLFEPLYRQACLDLGENMAGEAAMACLTCLRRLSKIDLAMVVHRVVPSWPKPLLGLAGQLGRVDCVLELLETTRMLAMEDPGPEADKLIISHCSWSATRAAVHNQPAVIDSVWDQLDPLAKSKVLVEAMKFNHPALVEYLVDKGADFHAGQPWCIGNVVEVLSHPDDHALEMMMPYFNPQLCVQLSEQLKQHLEVQESRFHPIDDINARWELFCAKVSHVDLQSHMPETVSGNSIVSKM